MKEAIIKNKYVALTWVFLCLFFAIKIPQFYILLVLTPLIFYTKFELFLNYPEIPEHIKIRLYGMLFGYFLGIHVLDSMITDQLYMLLFLVLYTIYVIGLILFFTKVKISFNNKKY